MATIVHQLCCAIIIGLGLGQSEAAEDANQLEAALSEARSAAAAKGAPAFINNDQDVLTLRVSESSGGLDADGRCANGMDVVITTAASSVATPCESAEYHLHLNVTKNESEEAELAASQVLFDGSIAFVVRQKAASESEGRGVSSSRVDLAQAVSRLMPGDRLLLAPGQYTDIHLTVPQSVSGTADRPIIIDGHGQVVFTGRTQINIAGNYIVLRGMKFEDAIPTPLSVFGRSFRLTQSTFDKCGDPGSTQSQCIFIAPTAAEAEIESNEFSDSYSVTIKIRAAESGAPAQPTGAYIHHNLFRDITQRSGNGQEVIQIAGPRGGAALVDLDARVENNIFYRTDGDPEAVSIKGSGVSVRWNVFRDMDAAPNLRGTPGNILSDNLLVRTWLLRVAGSDQIVERNVIVCPRQKVGIGLSNGSARYEPAIRVSIAGNLVLARNGGVVFMTQDPTRTALASQNRIVGNKFLTGPKGIAIYSGDGPIEPYLAVNTIEGNHTAGELAYLTLCSQ